MPAFDAYALLEFAVPVERRLFTDPRQPGKEFPLTLKGPEFPDRMLASQVAEKLALKWVRPPSGKRPAPFPPPPARPIQWSEPFCRALGLIEALQVPADPSEVLDGEALALISIRMPTAWAEIALWVGDLEKQTDELPEGNGSAAPGDRSCAPPPTGAAPIPPSISTSLTYSGASTNDLPEEQG